MPDYSPQRITEKSVWEKFILSRPEANFLQSWNWGVFHEKLGKKVFRLAIVKDDVIVAGALCVCEKAKRGTYLTIAGGPLADWNDEKVLTAFMNAAQQLAREQKCLFVRIRPQEIDSPALRKTVQLLHYTESPMHLTADLTLQLDLTKSEEELLAGMRKNTRYDVRRAQREGIEVKISEDPNEIQAFFDVQLEVAKKHHFIPFSYQFLYEQFVTFAADGQAKLFHSYKDGALLATAFILFYHDEAVYHYGISTPANDRLPGSYACQWAAICWAKAQGGKKYNFWGIAPEDKPDHRFAGVSLFKRGFGGVEVQYLPAHDLPVSWKYGFVKIFETVRKNRRKL
jgi:lipid II:glycine glycyltransferase (peptidoglycan interpeptide bridge formation enzyme)